VSEGTPPQTYYLRSFGCQMNDHDSERIAGMLEALGMRRVDGLEEAGAVVFNTCSIREKADNRLLGHLGGAKRLKSEHPERLIIVAGCLAQSRQQGFFADYPFVDVLVGPQSLHELPLLLQERLETGRRTGAFQPNSTRWSAELPRVRRAGPLASVQIMTGCTNFCSYCIVPFVRGPEASRKARDVVEEAKGLAAEGVREIMLLGQNVNAYGGEAGFAGTEDFPSLLDGLASIPGVERLRFMTSHPKDMSDRLIGAMADLPPVCEHLHLPVQSGSDRILALMRRDYTRARYTDLVARLRAAVPDLALTTDLIVGFPSETEDDFRETLDLVHDCEFDAAFTFVYSARPDTRAASLPGRPAAEVAEERMRRLVELVQSQGLRKNRAWLGRTVEVLVEGTSKYDRSAAMGRTRGHKIVNIRPLGSGSDAGAGPQMGSGPRSEPRPGDLVDVVLEDCTSTSFRGRLAS
jgi:tRNA-2-methylthio-N6-dimethylallyladenosine synthase